MPTANFDAVDRVARTDYAINAGDLLCHPHDIGLWPTHCANAACGPATLIDEAAARTKGQQAAAFGATGVNYPLSAVTDSAVRDGLTNTYLIGEKYLNPDHYETGNDNGDNENMYIGFNEDNARWTFSPPLHDRTGVGVTSVFGSIHSSGFNAVMCDGSVHTINFSINADTHQWLGNRADGQVISGDAL